MNELLLLKTLGNECIIHNVKQIEEYVQTHQTILRVEIGDEGVMVYDDKLLLLNIQVEL